MNTIRLENTSAGHNKFYEFVGVKAPGRFTVKGLYGRIGQAPNESVIYDGDDVNEANGQFHKKMAEKQKKGYVVVSNNVKTAKPATEEKKTLLRLFQ
jgi:predicted DNA-binding WGR domain protein